MDFRLNFPLLCRYNVGCNHFGKRGVSGGGRGEKKIQWKPNEAKWNMMVWYSKQSNGINAWLVRHHTSTMRMKKLMISLFNNSEKLVRILLKFSQQIVEDYEFVLAKFCWERPCRSTKICHLSQNKGWIFGRILCLCTKCDRSVACRNVDVILSCIRSLRANSTRQTAVDYELSLIYLTFEKDYGETDWYNPEQKEKYMYSIGCNLVKAFLSIENCKSMTINSV